MDGQRVQVTEIPVGDVSRRLLLRSIAWAGAMVSSAASLQGAYAAQEATPDAEAPRRCSRAAREDPSE